MTREEMKYIKKEILILNKFLKTDYKNACFCIKESLSETYHPKYKWNDRSYFYFWNGYFIVGFLENHGDLMIDKNISFSIITNKEYNYNLSKEEKEKLEKLKTKHKIKEF